MATATRSRRSEMDRGEAPDLKPKGDVEGQEPLIETDHEEDKPIIKQARLIRSLGRERSEVQDRETKARLKLLDLMKERGKDTYKFGDIDIRVKHGTDKISVRVAEDESDDE